MSSALAPIRRALPAVPQEAQKKVASLLDQFEKNLGGRQAVVEALAAATTVDGIEAEQAEYVVGCLADPRFADRTLRYIAKRAGITLTDLLRLYRVAAVQRAHLESLSHIARGLPATTKHVMDRSIPYEAACGKCLGAGALTAEPTEKQPNPVPVLCVACNGLGTQVYEPDIEHTKLALALGGLVKQGGGVSIVNIQSSSGGGSSTPLAHGDALVKLQQASDAALYGKPDVVDGDVTPVPDPPPEDPSP